MGTHLHGVLIMQCHLQGLLQLFVTVVPQFAQVVPCAIELKETKKTRC